MPGRNPREAYENYADPLKRVLSCVTRGQLFCKGGYQTPGITSLVTFHNTPVQLSDSPYTLFLTQHFKIVPSNEHGWKVTTERYVYAIERQSDKKEIVAFHWDPTETGSVHYAHVHAELQHLSRKTHIPTGRVPIEDVVWFAIHELGVTPLTKDFEKTILGAREAFIKHKTW